MQLFIFDKNTGQIIRIVSAENLPRCVSEVTKELSDPRLGFTEKAPYQGESYSKEEIR